MTFRSVLRASLLGLACAAGATAAQAILGAVAPEIAPYTLVFPAALLATLRGGLLAGLIAGAVGITAEDYIFIEPAWSFDLGNINADVGFAISACSLLSVLWMADQYRTIMASRASQREETLRSQLNLFERSHGLMSVLGGADWRYEYANPAHLRHIGKAAEAVLGKTLLEVAPNTEPAHLDLLEQVRRTGQAAFQRNMATPVQEGGGNRTLYLDFGLQPVRIKDGVVEAVLVEGYDVTDKVEAEQRLRLLAHEVDHRANNLLTVVQSVISLTRGESVEELKRETLGRIGALAKAHQLLAETRWRGADLGKLVEEELRPYSLGDAMRTSARGCVMPLNPMEAQAIAMAIHELATNAAKYGALSTSEGRVEVVWTRDEAGNRHIRWQEDGGPPVLKPDRRGLGARVLEQALTGVQGGRTQLHWRSEGVVCEFDLPPNDRGDLTAP